MPTSMHISSITSLLRSPCDDFVQIYIQVSMTVRDRICLILLLTLASDEQPSCKRFLQQFHGPKCTNTQAIGIFSRTLANTVTTRLAMGRRQTGCISKCCKISSTTISTITRSLPGLSSKSTEAATRQFPIHKRTEQRTYTISICL